MSTIRTRPPSRAYDANYSATFDCPKCGAKAGEKYAPPRVMPVVRPPDALALFGTFTDHAACLHCGRPAQPRHDPMQ